MDDATLPRCEACVTCSLFDKYHAARIRLYFANLLTESENAAVSRRIEKECPCRKTPAPTDERAGEGER